MRCPTVNLTAANRESIKENLININAIFAFKRHLTNSCTNFNYAFLFFIHDTHKNLVRRLVPLPSLCTLGSKRNTSWDPVTAFLVSRTEYYMRKLTWNKCMYETMLIKSAPNVSNNVTKVNA